MTSEPRGMRGGPDVARRGVLLGTGLAGLGGMLASCSTAAVPYGANEAGVPPRSGSAPSAMTGATSPISPGSTGIVLGIARDIPVGGGRIFTTERVVVTQPSRDQFRAFSAVCTHVGCVLNEVAGGTIDCPCHGSRFRITNGSVVTGPASRPLPKKQIAITDGRIILL
jgi:Rieske Fe-S protein